MECIESVRMQTYTPTKIIIIDNASNDDTCTRLSALVEEHPNLIAVTHLTQNTGGAGGFNEGIKLAYFAGADWIWVMDDDCVPQSDCLEKLLNARNLILDHQKEIGFLASRVLWTDGTPCRMNLPFQHPLWIESHAIDPRISRIAGSSFVSMLINRAAIEQHGLPIKEFFIWFDDVEYSRRISTTLPGYLVTDSVVTHKTPGNIDALDFNLLDEKSLWKFKYGVRNQCSYHFENGGVVEGMLFVGKVLARLSRARRNWRLRAAILGACFQGYRFRYRRYIEHVQSRPT